MALYGLLINDIQNQDFTNQIKPIASINIALPLIGGQQKLEELIFWHAPKGAKLVSVGEICDIDVVLFGSDNLIGYNSEDLEDEQIVTNYPCASFLEPKVKIIPVNYYGYN